MYARTCVCVCVCVCVCDLIRNARSAARTLDQTKKNHSSCGEKSSPLTTCWTVHYREMQGAALVFLIIGRGHADLLNKPAPLKEWGMLGPFSIGKGELDGDPLDRGESGGECTGLGVGLYLGTAWAVVSIRALP